MKDEKKRLRNNIRAGIAGFSEEYIKYSDERIFQAVSGLPEFKSAGTIFVYCSAGREPDTRKIIELALEQGKIIALPLIKGAGIMEARSIINLDDLEEGPWGGISQPRITAELLPSRSLDLIIVPALAYDRNGVRLGQGGGYYDRFLEGTPAFTVGLCRDRLLFDNLPKEEHDVLISCVITEKEIARPG